ncbi:MAG: hypothetical protein ACRDPC_08530 [Solirubrobacteraceae bacterium]
MRRAALLAAVALAGCGSSAAPERAARAAAPGPCDPQRVHYTPYPGHGVGLDGIPWIEGSAHGLVGLLWYWPQEWRRERVAEARIYTGGVAPAGYNTKIMWRLTLTTGELRATADLRAVPAPRP